MAVASLSLSLSLFLSLSLSRPVPVVSLKRRSSLFPFFFFFLFFFFFYIDFIPIENNVSLARDVPLIENMYIGFSPSCKHKSLHISFIFQIEPG